MQTIIVGNRKLARHLFQYTTSKGWNVVGALVPEGDLAAKQANFVPFSELVAGTSCRLHQTSDINSAATSRWLQELDPDVCLCGGWSQIIEEEILNIPDQGFLGFHSSRLPEGRGGAPVNWSIIDGVDDVWISLFYYTAEVDAGDILAQSSVPVEHRDDVATVFDALANGACSLLSSVREELETGNVDAKSQSLIDATYRPRRQPQDGLIDWNRDPESQYDWIRAQTEPYPGAYTFYSGEKLTVWDAETVNVASGNDAIGEVIDIVSGEGVDVRSGNGAIRLKRVKPGDRASRWADRYAREADLSPGDTLGRHQAPENWRYTGIRGSEQPTKFDTNLESGKRGELTMVSFGGSQYDLTALVELNGGIIYRDTTAVWKEYRKTIEYEPTELGTHSISVQFEIDGNRADTRYLKIFVHD
jgi:methionyl-tRNA formyltransferase